MRLTLRTLLAYLDDTLEPAAAREIGQKLAESEVAQELVTRIREVTRRRRLTTPGLVGDEMESNRLAEYLDNLLDAEAITAVETVCLESDIHLAEAAACHQILTLIGQPAKIAPAMRQRMYDLAKGAAAPAGESATQAEQAHHAPAPLDEWRPIGPALLYGGAGALGVLVIAVLVWFSWPPSKPAGGERPGLGDARPDREAIFRPDAGPALNEPDVLSTPPPLTPVREISELPDETEKRQGAATPPGRSAAADQASPALPASVRPSEDMPARSTGPAGSNLAPRSEAAETKPTSAAAESAARSKPADAEPAAAAERVPARTAAPAATAAKDAGKTAPDAARAADTARAPLGTYSAKSGVLMHLDTDAKEWRRLTPRTRILPNDPLLALPTYRATIQIDGGAWLELSGDTELTLLEPPPEIDARIRLSRGHLVLGTNNLTGTFQIDFADPWSSNGPVLHAWRLTLRGPETTAGIELAAPWRPGKPTVAELALVLPRGEAELVTDKQAEKLGGPVELDWDAAQGFHDRQALAAPPSWLEREEISPQMARASERLEVELKPNASVALPLIEAAGGTRREERLLAVQCLSALGRLEPLIDAMGTLDRPDVRREAIRALRQYMARGPAQEEALWQTLTTKLKDLERANAMVGLLRGYSDADSAKPETYEQLLTLLNFSELSVRELAIENLRELTGSQLNYAPDKPSDNTILAWRRLVEERVAKGAVGRDRR